MPTLDHSSSFSWLDGFLACSDGSQKPSPPRKLEHRRFAVKIENLLSEQECKFLIERAEDKGFEAAMLNYGYGKQKMNTDIRNHLRCIHDDEDLCRELFRRIRPHVETFTRQGPGDRLLVPRELNERLRILKYESRPGEPHYFKEHQDGVYPRPRDHPRYPDRSCATVLLYLNGGFEGGTTRLHSHDETSFEDVVPQTGLVLIHDHEILHEGMPVKERTGEKYIIRTDIMYTIHK